jgi:pSer/pThr/pTyr-binding forkhead associated (FHA) protein
MVVEYRPIMRPAMGRLHIYDDGIRSGEVVRVRKWPFVIGRADGDFTVPHDPQISSRHAQIVVKQVAGKTEWYLQDLGSTNGTFVRATQIVLKPGQVMMIGSRLFDGRNLEAEPPKPSRPGATLAQSEFLKGEGGLDGWVPVLRQIGGALRKITSTADPQELALSESGAHDPDAWYIGSDPDLCDLVLDDQFVDPRHARIYRDEGGRWRVDDLNSVNGTWLKIKETRLGKGAEFQCGEQRFRIEIAERDEGTGFDR